MHLLICNTVCGLIRITCFLCACATGALMLSYLCHTLVLIYWHKLVAHAVDQKDRNSQLSVIDLIPLRPVLTTHHGSQDKRRHIEGIALLQELFFFSALTSKSSSERSDKERKRHRWQSREAVLSSNCDSFNPHVMRRTVVSTVSTAIQI